MRTIQEIRDQIQEILKSPDYTLPGKPIGTRHESVLDKHIEAIRNLRRMNVPIGDIAKLCGVGRSTIIWYLKSRWL
jgi:hypothetical protein